MARLKAVLIGDVCIDHNVSKGITYSSWGSSVLHIAQRLKNQSIAVEIIAAYGPDFKKYAKLFPLYPAQPQLARTVVFENDQRPRKRLQKCHNDAADSTIKLDATYKQMLKTADIIMVCPILARPDLAYLNQILAYSSGQALKVLLPQGYFRQVNKEHEVVFRKHGELDDIIGLFNLSILSAEDCPAAMSQAHRWAGSAGYVIITQGSAGATAVGKGLSKRVRTKPVSASKVLDFVGCGDVFAAAVAADFHQRGDIVQAVAAGNQAAGAYLVTKAIS